jgi:hypothetical protein
MPQITAHTTGGTSRGFENEQQYWTAVGRDITNQVKGHAGNKRALKTPGKPLGKIGLPKVLGKNTIYLP